MIGNHTLSLAEVIFLQNFGLKQFVSEPTRYNKILDLVLRNCELINYCSVSEEFSDHLSVLFKIQSNKKSKKFTNILSTDKKIPTPT